MKTPTRGFTLIEMLVSLGIIVIITSIVLLGQSSFNRGIVLTDTAYTVAFTLREAQSLGLSSRKFGLTQNAGYGVHFTSANKTAYSLFSDTIPTAPGSTQGGKCAGHSVSSGAEAKPGNCIYDSIAEQVTAFTLNKGFTISSFCGVDTGGSTRCSGSYLDAMDITFLRPSTQASITGTRAGTIIELVSAIIHISSPDGTQERCVKVTRVGQIAVSSCS